MLKSVKTSENNRTVVRELTNKLGLGPENFIARLAFAYSISKNRKLNLSDIEDSKGKEYSSTVLFGDYLPLYVAIISQVYGVYKTDYDIPKYIKMHIDDGLNLISGMVKSNPNLPLLEFILEQANEGLKSLSGDI
jgi:DNA sulfur modification protein DndE